MADTSSVRSAPRSNTGPILFVLLAAGLLIAGILFLGGRKTEAAPSDGVVKSTLHLEAFILNLAGPGQRSYLRVGIDLGLGREKGKSGEEPIAQVRDTILSVLGQSRADEILTEKGKSTLKAEVLRSLQERVPSLAVKEVYFTEFLIQR